MLCNLSVITDNGEYSYKHHASSILHVVEPEQAKVDLTYKLKYYKRLQNYISW